VYVLITSVAPLRIYLFDGGLTRFCTQDYAPPNDTNLVLCFDARFGDFSAVWGAEWICFACVQSSVRAHLTNYALNKQSDSFVFNTDSARDDVGSKWYVAGRESEEMERIGGGRCIKSVVCVWYLGRWMLPFGGCALQALTSICCGAA
jgi:hypothetical protein